MKLYMDYSWIQHPLELRKQNEKKKKKEFNKKKKNWVGAKIGWGPCIKENHYMQGDIELRIVTLHDSYTLF